MALRFYFLLIPLTFNSYLRKNIDNKSFMDLSVYFRLFPWDIKIYLSRNIYNKSSMNLLVYFLKVLRDI